MGDPRGWMELGVDAVTAPVGHDAAVLGLGVLLDDLAKVAERRAGLDELNGLVQALPRRLDDPDRVWVGLGAFAHVVGLVDVGVVAPVVQGDVEVEDVAVQQDSLVGDSVADYFIGRSAQ